VWTRVKAAAGDPTAPVWDDSVLDHPAGNAGGVEWDGQSLANGQTASCELITRSAVPSALQLNPTNAGSRQRVPIAITATATDSNGQPYAGKTLRWAFARPNAQAGAATLGPAGPPWSPIRAPRRVPIT